MIRWKKRIFSSYVYRLCFHSHKCLVKWLLYSYCHNMISDL